MFTDCEPYNLLPRECCCANPSAGVEERTGVEVSSIFKVQPKNWHSSLPTFTAVHPVPDCCSESRLRPWVGKGRRGAGVPLLAGPCSIIPGSITRLWHPVVCCARHYAQNEQGSHRHFETGYRFPQCRWPGGSGSRFYPAGRVSSCQCSSWCNRWLSHPHQTTSKWRPVLLQPESCLIIFSCRPSLTTRGSSSTFLLGILGRCTMPGCWRTALCALAACFHLQDSASLEMVGILASSCKHALKKTKHIE